MSTRATYKFEFNSEYHADQTFYIHHDGYRQGAAYYFWMMVDYHSEPSDGEHYGDGFEPCADGLMGAFYRANRKCEHTKSHEIHGDTEFQYNVRMKNRTVEVKQRTADWSKHEFETIGVCSLAEFINNHVDPEWIGESYSPVHDNGERLFTEANGSTAAERLRKYAERFDDSNPNKKGYNDRADKLELVSS